MAAQHANGAWLCVGPALGATDPVAGGIAQMPPRCRQALALLLYQQLHIKIKNARDEATLRVLRQGCYMDLHLTVSPVPLGCAFYANALTALGLLCCKNYKI